MADWLQPLNKMKLQKAFRARSSEVTLKFEQGEQVFTCEYYNDLTAEVGRRRKVLVKPKQPVGEGFSPHVPMGRFDLKTVLHSEWLTGKEVTPADVPTQVKSV